jgi:hypothetical protein
MVQSSEQLAVFERAVKEKPHQVRVFGPPSWMVAERLSPKPDAIEVGKVTAELRAEYGLDEPVPRRPEKGPHPAEHVEGECGYCRQNVADPVADREMSPVDVADRPDTCSVCGENEPQPGRRVCSACRKAAQRAKS